MVFYIISIKQNYSIITILSDMKCQGCGECIYSIPLPSYCDIDFY